MALCPRRREYIVPEGRVPSMVVKIGAGYVSDLAAQKLAEARHEPLGLLDMGRMPAVGYELQGSFRKTGSRLPTLRGREYLIARAPHDERRHRQV